jgi:hypothetical protein
MLGNIAALRQGTNAFRIDLINPLTIPAGGPNAPGIGGGGSGGSGSGGSSSGSGTSSGSTSTKTDSTFSGGGTKGTSKF